MKDTKALDSGDHDTENNYHHYKDLSWESPTVQTGQIAGDCVDVNTENPKVAEYLNTVYGDYINMGVDAFRMDTESMYQDLLLTSSISHHGLRQAERISMYSARFVLV